MFDIDHFKSVNDQYGHAAGDKVLKGIADIIRSKLRKSDFVGRYGGEEFCVTLANTGIDGAFQAAERYRQAIEAHDFAGIPVTSSFGVSSTKFDAKSTADLIDQADQSLYNAKNGGRNCVKSWGEILPDISKKNSNAQTAKINKAKTVSGNNGNRSVPKNQGIPQKPISKGAGQKVSPTVKNNQADRNIPAKKAFIANKVQPSAKANMGIAHLPVPKNGGSKSSIRPETAPTVLGADKVPGTDASVTAGSKDALGLVRDALNDSNKISGAIGLNVALNKVGNTAIQVNQKGGWGDGGEIESKKRLEASSISQVANLLKQLPQAKTIPGE